MILKRLQNLVSKQVNIIIDGYNKINKKNQDLPNQAKRPIN